MRSKPTPLKTLRDVQDFAALFCEPDSTIAGTFIRRTGAEKWDAFVDIVNVIYKVEVAQYAAVNALGRGKSLRRASTSGAGTSGRSRRSRRGSARRWPTFLMVPPEDGPVATVIDRRTRWERERCGWA
jgi:hypothetical protein